MTLPALLPRLPDQAVRKFQTSAEAVEASSASLFTLTSVERNHDNWAYLLERCYSVSFWHEGSVFIGLGWCVLLPNRVRREEP